MSKYEQLWLIAFTKTQLIEITFGVLVLYIYALKRDSVKLKLPHCCAMIFIASGITHPLLWFVFPAWRKALGMSYNEYVLYGELIVFMIEALWYWIALETIQRSVFVALALSLFLNYCSYSLGVYFW